MAAFPAVHVAEFGKGMCWWIVTQHFKENLRHCCKTKPSCWKYAASERTDNWALSYVRLFNGIHTH